MQAGVEGGGSPTRIRITSHSLTQSLIYGEKHDYILRLPSDIGVEEGGKTKRAVVRACVRACTRVLKANSRV